MNGMDPGRTARPEQTPAATVTILTYNGERYIGDILGALSVQRLDEPFEILVIDSGSRDRTLEIVRSHPDVRLHEIPNSEFGHGRTRNLAAHLARGRVVAYLTHDAVPAHDHWLYELLKPFELNDRVAAVMGKQVARPWCFPLLKYEIRSVFEGFGPDFGTSLFYRDGFVTSESVSNAVAFYSDVNSAARRDVLTGDVPYRDVSYAEDQLLGRDLVMRGYLKAYAPRAVVVHSNDLSLREYDDRMFEETQGLREVGIDVAVPSYRVVAKMIARGVVRDFARLLRDPDFGPRRKLYYVAVNPLFHLQKWRGVRRGALAPAPVVERAASVPPADPSGKKVPLMTADPSSEGPTPRVGLLYDSVSQNTGDIAIGIASVQELARHGIHDVVDLDPFAPSATHVDTVIVGGGELIRPVGDPFYDAFRFGPGTVLNAVGVWQSAEELDHLAGYARVSARSTAEAEVLSRFVPEVQVLACTTTTLESSPIEIEGVGPDDVVVGIHVVPHTLALCPDIVEIVDAIPHRKVFIPFTHYNYDASFMQALPFDRSNAITLPRLAPLELHAAIGQMSYVITSSLHASLFAYSQNVPFASAFQEKVWNYFRDRGLERFVYRSSAELRVALEEIEAGSVDFAEAVARDKVQVREAYAAYAALARAAADRRAAEPDWGERRLPTDDTDHASRLARERLLSAQLENVVLNRDSVLHGVMLRALGAEHEADRWHVEADRLAGRIRELESDLGPA